MKAGDLRWLDEPEQVPSDRIRYPAPSAQLLDGLAPAGGLGQTKQANLDLLPTVVLGVELANSLSVDVGQQIRIISPDGDIGPTGLRPKLRSYRVAGIFATGMYEYDQKLAYMAIDDAQRFFNFDATVNQIEIRLKDASLTDAATRSVREVIAGSTIKAKVTDWQERNKSLFAALQLERIVMFIVLGFIILVASLLIVSSLVMLIVEKAREIAVFKALGAADHTIVRTFLLIGSVIGAIGSASGLTLGIGTCLAIEHLGIPLPQEYYISRLPVAMDVGEVAVVGAAAFFICVLATIYPSREASALKAVEGLRHG
jgi:lipoprotein-releasing system permease protein